MAEQRANDEIMKRPYERPRLRVYGSVETLTKTGLTGAVESGSSSGQKKRNSLL